MAGIGLWLVAWVLIGCTATPQSATIVLKGLHPFLEGDDPSYARADFNDAAWPRAQVPGEWTLGTSRTAGLPAVAWYRLHFRGPDRLPNEPLGLWLGLVGTCDEVFLNGTLLGAELGCRGRLVEGPPLPRAYLLPSNLLRSHENNVLAIRVRSGYQPPHGISGPDLLVGPWAEQSMLLLQAGNLLHFRDGAMLVVLLLSSIAATALWFLAERRSPYRLAALSLWCLLLIAALDSHVVYMLGKRSENSQRLSEALSAVLPGLLWLALTRFVGTGAPWHWITRPVVWVVSCAFFLTALARPTALYAGWGRSVYELFVLVALASVLWILGRALRQRGFTLLPVALGTVALGLSALLESHGLSSMLLPPSFVSDLGLLTMVTGTNVSLIWHFVVVRRAHDAMVQRLAQASEQERRHLARELHDHVAPSLALVKLELDRLASRSLDATATVTPWQQLRDALSSVIADLRSISHDLRPSTALGLSLDEAMQRYVDRLQTQRPSGLTITLQAQPMTLGDESTTQVYRIFQEALQNALRHAQASSIQVVLQNQETQAILTITDDGKGIPDQPGKRAGIGLLHIQERAALIGASLSIASSAAHGTQLVLRIPIPSALVRSEPARQRAAATPASSTTTEDVPLSSRS